MNLCVIFLLGAVVFWGPAASDISSPDPSTELAVFSAVNVLPSLITEGSPIAAPEQHFEFMHAGAVTVAQDWSSHSLGASVWSAGVMLAHYLDAEAPLFLPCARRSEDEKHPRKDDSSDRSMVDLYNLTGCTAIEVGSGASGLGSVVLERLGAAVVATDGDDVILPLLKENLATASVHGRVLPLQLPWGNATAAHVARCEVAALRGEHGGGGGQRKGDRNEGNEHTREAERESPFAGHSTSYSKEQCNQSLESHPPDLVLAADVVYPGNAEHWPKLLQTLAQLAAPESTMNCGIKTGVNKVTKQTPAVAAKARETVVLVALTRRGGGSAMVDAFLELARKSYGFNVDVVPAAAATTGAVELGDGNELYQLSL